MPKAHHLFTATGWTLNAAMLLSLLLTGVLVSRFIMFYVGRMGPTPYLTSSPNYVRPRQTVR